jgi:2-aminoadipate transaminase
VLDRSAIEALWSERAQAAPAAAPVAPGPVLVNFDQGLPDPLLFPVERLAHHLAATIAEQGEDALRYFGTGGPSEMQYGALGLRDALARWMGRRDGRPLDPAQVTLVNGSTDGLALAVNAFLGPGDGAICEAATYPYTRRYIGATGAAVRTVPVDEHGMVVEAIEAELEALRDAGVRPKLVATIPTFHSPTGTVMPLARREALVDLARRWQVLVLEDNCYYEFAYDEPPPPTLLALDDAGLVLQSDSFSKYVAPGLRMAWLAGHPAAIEAVTRVRQDFAVSRLVARTLERYVDAGDLDAHLASLRDHYRRKRDRTAAALVRHCGRWVRFAVPAGGFYFWVEIDPSVDWDAARATLAAQGIAFRPGDRFGDDPTAGRFVRLSPIQVPEDAIEPAIAAMGAALAAHAGPARPGA